MILRVEIPGCGMPSPSPPDGIASSRYTLGDVHTEVFESQRHPYRRPSSDEPAITGSTLPQTGRHLYGGAHKVFGWLMVLELKDGWTEVWERSHPVDGKSYFGATDSPARTADILRSTT